MSTKISSLNDIEPLAKYLRRIGAKPRSLQQAMVEETRGKYWKDTAVIKISQKTGEITVEPEHPNYLPTDSERDAIKAAYANITFPQPVSIASIDGLPDDVKSKKLGKDLFIFQNDKSDVVMVHERVETSDPKSGELEKKYVPWTPFDDGVWRRQESGGKLPLYNRQLINATTTAIGLHEGPKSAWRLTELQRQGKLAGEPWGDYLKDMVHIGWIGGALNPGRTDWSAINNSGSINTVFVFSDNDFHGKGAVPGLAYRIRKQVVHVQLTDDFPDGFDFGDDWPEGLLSYIGPNGVPVSPQQAQENPGDVVRIEIGPTFRECCHPATWATDVYPNPSSRGRPVIEARDNFLQEWQYAPAADLYINRNFPNFRLSEKAFNKRHAAFAHTSNLSAIVDRDFVGETVNVAYDPSQAGKRVVTSGGGSAINVFEETDLREVKPPRGQTISDAIRPWLDFTEYMFPDPRDRHEVMRWEATLASQLGTHMQYAQLWVSETHGIGKTVRANAVAKMVGERNVGRPSEREIAESDFNTWAAHRRLAICQEIYAGHSWKAYHNMKSTITDPDLRVHEKFQRPYVIQNWVHAIACSNSKKALKMEESDRRWFVPAINEIKWTDEGYEALHQWLRAGGLGFLLHWARNFEAWCREYYEPAFVAEHKLKLTYVHPKEPAPITTNKQDMIAASRSDAQREFADLLEAVEKDREISLPLGIVREWLRQKIGPTAKFDTDNDLKRVAKNCGWGVLGKRVRVEGQKQNVIVSPALWRAEWAEESAVDRPALDQIRKAQSRPANLIAEQEAI
ncbi:MAG: hypothetical protein KDJ29_03770 [Hyphomicrobiales bacterium]|nr:hypothetical protein [Hyphomicrobiales bacterium]